MVRADVYLTNRSKVAVAVGMTVIQPGKTEKILQKDFERKASYIDRMIKEGRLSLGAATGNDKVEAPSSEEVETTGGVVTPPVDTETDANNEDASKNADSKEEPAVEEPADEKEEEAPAEEEVKTEDVPAPKTRSRRKK